MSTSQTTFKSEQAEKEHYARKIIRSLENNLGISETSIGGIVGISSSVLSSISKESEKVIQSLVDKHSIQSLKSAHELLKTRIDHVSTNGTKQLSDALHDHITRINNFSTKINQSPVKDRKNYHKTIANYHDASRRIRDTVIDSIHKSVNSDIDKIKKSLSDVNRIKGADLIPDTLRGTVKNLGNAAGVVDIGLAVASDDAGAVLKNAITGCVGSIVGLAASSTIVSAITAATVAFFASAAWDYWGLDEFFGLSGESLRAQLSESIEIMLSDEDIDWSYLDDFIFDSTVSFWDWVTGKDDENYAELSRQDQYRIIDPLALDLDGDGIETVGINGFDSVLFDHKNNGIRSATGWIGKDDALLVLDRNLDGKIDTGLELFGDNTVLKDGTKSNTGYQALAEFDDNGDGMIDEQDAIFAQLRAWQDKNQDGISQSDELLNMSETRVKALHLNHQNTHKNLGNSNVLARRGSYIKTDNTEAEMGDLHFASNLMFSHIDTSGIELNDSLKLLPNLKGMGRLKDLRFAAAESEQLTNLLTQYSNAQTKQEQSALLDQLLIAWAKTDHLKALSGFDARLEMSSLSIQANDDDKNVILVTRAEYEALMRKRAAGLLPTHYEIPEIAFKVGILDSFTGQNSPKLYYATAEQAQKIIEVVNKSYGKLSQSAYESLLFQTRLKPYLNELRLNLNPQGEIGFDLSNVLSAFEQVHAKNPEKAFVDLGELIFYSQKNQSKLALNDLSRLYLHYAQIARENGQLEHYQALLGDDALKIFSHLSGTEGNDSLIGNDLASELLGKAGNDYLYGNAGHDYLDGGEGNDVLYAKNGDDILIGGTGNDYLDGSAGNDTYIFEKGHGQDTIHDYGERNNQDTIRFNDVNFEEIQFGRVDNHLTIQNKNGDSIKVNHFFHSDEYKIENFEFADQSLNLNDFKEQGLALHGTVNNDSLSSWEYKSALHGYEGNDYLYGSQYNDTLAGDEGNDVLYAKNGDDILIGGTGNDYLDGSVGNDTYIFEKGHGQDTIHDYGECNNQDTIRFKDIHFEEIQFGRVDNHLTIQNKNGDSIKVNHFFHSDEYKIENFEFADQSLNLNDFKEQGLTLHGTVNNDSLSSWEYKSALHGYEGNDYLYGSQYNDTLAGDEGNDVLYAKNGDDILIGGTGNDYLDGSAGNDTYIFEKGHGQDTIHDYGERNNQDTIRFKDIAFEKTKFSSEHNDLIIDGYHDNDSVRIKHFLNSDEYTIEQFEFSNHTLNWQSIKSDLQSNQNTEIIHRLNQAVTDYKSELNQTQNDFSDLDIQAMKQAQSLIQAMANSSSSDAPISLSVSHDDSITKLAPPSII